MTGMNTGWPAAHRRGRGLARRRPKAWPLVTLLACCFLLPAPRARAGTLADLLAHPPLVVEGTGLESAPLEQFYAARGFRPAWSLVETRALAQILRQAGNAGLDPGDYHLAALERAIERTEHLALPAVPRLRRGEKAAYLSPAADRQPAEKEPSEAEPSRMERAAAATARAELDLLASDAFLRYAQALGQGSIVPASIDPNWDVAIVPVDAVAALQRATVSPAALETVLKRLGPQNPAYRRLEAALERYRALAAKGGWTSVPAGPTLKPGMQDRRVEALRRRLGVAGPTTPSSDIYDSALVRAVRRFQIRNGLTPDGVVGPATLTLLNRTVGERIATLRANLERWRWLPHDLGPRYVMVNIAAQELTAVSAGSPAFDMRAVVGAADKPTPLLISRIRSVVFAPSWYVPRSIAVREILPKLQRDPSYLMTDNLRIRGVEGDAALGQGIDWAHYGINDFPFQLVQLPGAHNALGRVKFRFENSFDVYMHDTPEHRLFTLPVRDLSHGCVRLQEPAALALWLLQDNSGWDAARVATEMARTTTYTVRVRDPVPVYLLYFTAWVAPDGTVEFRRDLYGWDGKLDQALRHRLASRTHAHAGTG